MTARTRLGLLTALATGAFLLLAGPAAAAESPWWHLTQRLVPSRIEPEAEGTIVVQAINLGNKETGEAGEDGKFGTEDDVNIPYAFTDELPAGLELLKAEFFAPNPFGGSVRPDFGPSSEFFELELCKATTTSVTCNSESQSFHFDFLRPVVPYDFLEMKLTVKAEAGVEPGLLQSNAIGASGGGAPPEAIERPIPLGEEEIPFGLEHFSLTPEAQGGSVAAHAGSHPYQLTADVTFNRSDTNPFKPPALPRDLHFNLPPGQIGNATVTPKCSGAQFADILEGGVANACPSNTTLGAAIVDFSTAPCCEQHFAVPIFNLTPALGEPARFGFTFANVPIVLDTHLRSGNGGDYGVTVDVPNITQNSAFLGAITVFWGAPDSPSHNESRGWGCLTGGRFGKEAGLPCEPSSNPKPPAFLTLPTDCAAPYTPLFEGVSWPLKSAPQGVQAPPVSAPLADEAGNPLGLIACNQVPFDPRIEAEPTSNAATSPTGLNFDINVEDQGLLNAEGVAQSQIKRAVVTLPQGFTTNPSVAEGLKACSQAEYESTGLESGGCTEESKIGDVVIESPLVEPKVLGSLFVARQHDNPNGNLLTIYMVARNPELGVLIKQALKVNPDPVTGQLTTEVDNVPELPFSHFQLSFRQGQRSPLVTPPACGTYTVQADLYPWANPSTPVHRESSFQITQGPEGQGCPSGGAPPFHPNLEAGTINNSAGTYSPFYVHMTRRDSEQEITHFSIKLPPGVIGKLAGIPYCSDAAIAAAKAREREGGGGEEEASPSCPQASEVGHSLVGSGVGNVLAYAPGKMYLAGPYHGSNLSLVSITAAKVGPFDLGTVVVRFALRINPETAEVFVDSQGSDPIPHIVDGIPVHLRDIRAYVSRPQFVLNPTSCERTSTASTVLGSGLNFASEADDQPVTVTSPFQAADCASLGFAPKLALSLKGATKRGATPAFKAVLTYPRGSYANIAKSVLTLPHSEFLENAHIKTVCTRVQFKEGTVPGEKCPAGSVYGFAKAVTPILSEPLQGPVYLRSSEHKLPDLVAALHNAQVDIALDGRIDSVKGQIRNSFEAVPDAPVSKFTLEMQGGAKGLLVNSTNLCKGTHRAISEFTGQNGKAYDTKPVLRAQCGKGRKGKKGKHKR
jgi:hypothetical protein